MRKAYRVIICTNGNIMVFSKSGYQMSSLQRCDIFDMRVIRRFCDVNTKFIFADFNRKEGRVKDSLECNFKWLFNDKYLKTNKEAENGKEVITRGNGGDQTDGEEVREVTSVVRGVLSNYPH